MSNREVKSRIGARVVTVGLSAVTTVAPLATQNGVFFKIQSGSGTLYIVDSATFIDAATLPVVGYAVGATERIDITYGPAQFYLAAAGATMTVAVGLTYSSLGGASAYVL